MKQARWMAFATAAALGIGAWTGTAGALLESTSYSTSSTIDNATQTIDPVAVRYLVDRLNLGRAVTVSVSPGGDVSVPSIGGAIVGPPPPPPIVRDLLVRVARSFDIEGDVEITIGSSGGDVSVPSIGGAIVGPPPPPPIVRDLLDSIRAQTSKATYLVAKGAVGVPRVYTSSDTART